MTAPSLWRHGALVASDYWRLRRVCGGRIATRWLFAVAGTLDSCRREGSLGPADRAMGTGPFPVQLRGARATLRGAGAFSGIREIWARDGYLGGGFLSIGPADFVVDLGANIGNFTNLALAHGPDVQVVAVEPGLVHNEIFRASVGANGWLDRTRLLRWVVGESPESMAWLFADPQFAGAAVVSPRELLAALGDRPIDFLKCDIEGAEFLLMREADDVLERSKQIAMEIHDDSGERRTILDALDRSGFETMFTADVAGSCVVLARKRAGIASTAARAARP